MRIEVFSKDGCSPCSFVKDYLGNNNVPHQVINVLENRERLIELNVTTVPVTFLFNRDNEVVARKNGFNKAALDSLIKQYNEHLHTED